MGSEMCIRDRDFAALSSEVYGPAAERLAMVLERHDQDRSARAKARIQDYVSSMIKGMVRIGAGRFQMGVQRAGVTDARPVREVALQSFHIGAHPVTVAQYKTYLALSGKGGGRSGSAVPQTQVSWADARSYLDWLSRQSGRNFRLPSEAEWEYVARGQMDTLYSWGNAVGSANANCKNCGSRWDGAGPSPVGSFRKNQFGVFDINGNVWEWVQDCYAPDYRGAPSDGRPVEFPDCKRRVARGGAFDTSSRQLHPAYRSAAPPDMKLPNLGFRIALD